MENAPRPMFRSLMKIGSRLESLLLHLLEWKHQPEWQCGGWRGSLYEARRRIKRLIDESPSLRSLPGDYLPEAFVEARERALQETGLLRLPERCPWTIEQILDPNHLP